MKAVGMVIQDIFQKNINKSIDKFIKIMYNKLVNKTKKGFDFNV